MKNGCFFCFFAAFFLFWSLAGCAPRRDFVFDREPDVVFIHGWELWERPLPRQLEIIEGLFPGRKCMIQYWENPLWIWSCFPAADRFAAEAAERIMQMPPEKREGLVLIGHSAGARIVLRTLAHLAEKKGMIRRGILLAAAVGNSDPDMPLAVKASILPVINIYNPGDSVLAGSWFLLGEDEQYGEQLGTRGGGRDMLNIHYADGWMPESFCDHFYCHFANYYLLDLQRVKADLGTL